jgi:uncharacterized RDD family membrane protein YckC
MEFVNDTGHPLATPRHRLAANFVDAGFYIVTLGIGWAIWNLVTWSKGQTPGKQILKIRVYDATKSNKPANWGRMCIRQALIPGAMGFFWYALWMSSYFFFSPHIMPQVLILHVSTLGTICMYLILILEVAIHLADALWIFKPGTRRLTDYWAKTYVVNESEVL